MKEYEETEEDEREEGEIENKILRHFNFLNDENNFQRIYDEYNFEEEKNKLTEIWENIIKYIYEEISHSLTLSLKNIKQLSKIHGREPLGLSNILQYLRANMKYITEEDIKSNEFYEKNFPELYPKPTSFMNYFYLPTFCREECKENKGIECLRKDISYKNNIPENCILFNYDILNTHCEALIMVLNRILSEYGQEIIQKDIALKIIKEDYSDDSKEGNIKLRYGDKNIDDVIYFLKKMKKIIIFEIELKDKKYEFIKLAKSKDDSENEKDKKIAKILIRIDEQREKCKIIQAYIKQCKILAKNKLKDNDRKSAEKIIKKHNKLQNFIDIRNKVINSLEKKIVDIQNGKAVDYVDEEGDINDNKEIGQIFKKIDNMFCKNEAEENYDENEEINLELEKIINEV